MIFNHGIKMEYIETGDPLFTDPSIVIKSDNFDKDYRIFIWSSGGEFLAASPEPATSPREWEGKSIRHVIKPNQTMNIYKTEFKELNELNSTAAVIIQVFRYLEDSPIVLVSAPKLIDFSKLRNPPE